MPVFKCRWCTVSNDRWQQTCPACGLIGLVPEDSFHAMRARDREAAPQKGAVKTLAEAAKPRHVRVRTNIEGLDRVLGGGFRVPSVVMFGGTAGSGKSSLLLKACVSMRERSLLYITSEETLEDVRERAERFGLGAQLHLINAVATEELEEAMGHIRAADPRIVILDSINKIRDGRRDTRDKQNNLLQHSRAFIRESRDNDRVFVFVSHMNKEQELAGVQEVQHDVDAVMLLKKSGRRERVLSCPEKNRYGDTAEIALFQMLKTGLHEVDREAADDDDELTPRPSGISGIAAGSRPAPGRTAPGR